MHDNNNSNNNNSTINSNNFIMNKRNSRWNIVDDLAQEIFFATPHFFQKILSLGLQL